MDWPWLMLIRWPWWFLHIHILLNVLGALKRTTCWSVITQADGSYCFVPFKATAEVEVMDLRGVWAVTYKIEGGFYWEGITAGLSFS
jgi:hypothetical protein